MKSDELRQKFLEFFKGKEHTVAESAPLVPEGDSSTLFTTAGMQQFKDFYLHPKNSKNSRIATIQPCVRTSDIEEVGDESHLTYFEMLGNFSFGFPDKKGSYFKEEAIKLAFEFLTQVLGIEKSRISATYFDQKKAKSGIAITVETDLESKQILESTNGLNKIIPQGEDNFWSLGVVGSPGGPTVEFYIDGIEIWNLVFNDAICKGDHWHWDGVLKGVDTGMGLERLLAIFQGEKDVFKTDLFSPIIKELEKVSGRKYEEHKKEFRIIADHLKAAVFLIAENILPSNKDAGYVVRRLVRRAIVKGKKIGIENNFCEKLVSPVCHSALDAESMGFVRKELRQEEEKFRRTLDRALAKLKIHKEVKFGMSWSGGKMDWKDLKMFADNLFNLYQEDGMPLEVSLEEAKEMGIPVAEKAFEEAGVLKKIENEYDKRISEHQDLSRTASAGKFKGGLADLGEQTRNLHTAAHLLLAALRKVLGNDVYQKGSNITSERLRFDFSYPAKLTPEQLKQVEDLVNEQIKKALPVEMKEMSLDEAKKMGAMGVFESKYGDKVKVYSIGPSASSGLESPSASSGSIEKDFSIEICGGPHAKNTSKLSHFKIIKEESSSAGVRRIKAILE